MTAKVKVKEVYMSMARMQVALFAKNSPYCLL